MCCAALACSQRTPPGRPFHRFVVNRSWQRSMSGQGALARIVREVVKDPGFTQRFAAQQLPTIIQSYANLGVGKKVSRQTWTHDQSYYTITNVKVVRNLILLSVFDGLTVVFCSIFVREETHTKRGDCLLGMVRSVSSKLSTTFIFIVCLT